MCIFLGIYCIIFHFIRYIFLNNWVSVIDKLYNCTWFIHLILLVSCGKHYLYVYSLLKLLKTSLPLTPKKVLENGGKVLEKSRKSSGIFFTNIAGNPVSNHMLSKVWPEITYPLTHFNTCTAEVWECISNFIPQFIIVVITHPYWNKSQSTLVKVAPWSYWMSLYSMPVRIPCWQCTTKDISVAVWSVCWEWQIKLAAWPQVI